MSLTGLLLGIINILIVVAVLLLIGYLIQWILSALAGIAIPAPIVKIYLVIVALIAVYLLVALLVGGIPTIRLLGHATLSTTTL